MEKYYIIYNPQSGNGIGRKSARELEHLLDGSIIYISMPKIKDYKAFFKSVKNDHIVICGGDGTLNYFINKTKDINYKNKILYYSAGSGNDFLNDIGPNKKHEVIDITNYLKNLPSLYVGKEKYKFLNGVGLGIDGYACYKVKEKKKKKINKNPSYVLETLKGFLYAFKPVDAEVKIDNKKYNFKNVWMISIMKGRYYGGGVKIAPSQDRLNKKHELCIIIGHTRSKNKILKALLGLKKGNHIKNKDIVECIYGNKIYALFSKPSYLQYDGEVITNVNEFEVKSKERKLF